MPDERIVFEIPLMCKDTWELEKNAKRVLEFNLTEDEYHQIEYISGESYQGRPEPIPPDQELIVFWVTGSSEGYYVHIEHRMSNVTPGVASTYCLIKVWSREVAIKITSILADAIQR